MSRRIWMVSIMLALGPGAALADEAEVTGPSAPPVSGGVDRLELDAAAIRGNQELPRVLYILPWKDPEMAELAGRPVNSLVEEVLSPVDREVFRRQVGYFDQLYGTAEKEVAGP